MQITTINFKILINSFVSLRILDKSGNTIATLLNEVKQAGNYNVNFDAAKYHLIPGIYFCELKAGNNFESKQLIFIK